MSALDDWFYSGQAAVITGRRMRLREHPLTRIPFEIARGQASSYWVDGEDNTEWILKRFSPARRPQRSYIDALAGCVPQLAEFRCGWDRRVLVARDLEEAYGAYSTPELVKWLDGTVLMPRLGGEAWGTILADVADGSGALELAQRLAIARRLAEVILLLEMAEASHRDLSATNILIDIRDNKIHLIDWDSLYHPSLPFQQNTTVGTPGYMAPWVANDAKASWRTHADRFALAVCVAEILVVGPGTRLYGDGSLFQQSDLGYGSQALAEAVSALHSICPPAANLALATWQARTFDACPSPGDWVAATGDAQGDTQFARWARAVPQLLDALRDERDDDVEHAIVSEPALERLLTSEQRASLGQARARAAALRALRTALRSRDDAAILRAAGAVGPRRVRLRGGEVLQIEMAAQRARALASLTDAVQRGDESATVVAWWQATLAGCEVPRQLAVAARRARGRQLPASPSSSIPAPKFNVDHSAGGQISARSARHLVASIREEQDRAADGLRSAIAGGQDRDIAAAALTVRRTGAQVPSVSWDVVHTVEQRVADLADLDAALQDADAEKAALAWAKVAALWADAIDPITEASGRKAFRHWGSMLRAKDVAGVGS